MAPIKRDLPEWKQHLREAIRCLNESGAPADKGRAAALAKHLEEDEFHDDAALESLAPARRPSRYWAKRLLEGK
jgi:hypothetical protein